MRVKTEDGVKDLQALWLEDDGRVVMMEQRIIPERLEFMDCRTVEETAVAIEDMVVRGAPAIGAAGALGMAQAHILGEDWASSKARLWKTRPTAYDLFYALEYMDRAKEAGADLVKAARDFTDDIARRCKAIGEAGAPLIKDGFGVLTHCNAGALATVDWGTALAPMRIAHRDGTKFTVYSDETRPRLQGSRLTAWELENEDIPHYIIADNAAGHYMQRGHIQLAITGSDRVTANGDAANKIGTYEKAVLAKENGIPFYIAAPVSTFDLGMSDGMQIPIEERDCSEVTQFEGRYMAHSKSPCKNPGFDVTPARYIAGYITEIGIITADEIPDRIGAMQQDHGKE